MSLNHLISNFERKYTLRKGADTCWFNFEDDDSQNKTHKTIVVLVAFLFRMWMLNTVDIISEDEFDVNKQVIWSVAVLESILTSILSI